MSLTDDIKDDLSNRTFLFYVAFPAVVFIPRWTKAIFPKESLIYVNPALINIGYYVMFEYL